MLEARVLFNQSKNEKTSMFEVIFCACNMLLHVVNMHRYTLGDLDGFSNPKYASFDSSHVSLANIAQKSHYVLLTCLCTL